MLRTHGLPTTSHTQGLVLGYIGMGIKRPSVIARMIGISAQALTLPLNDLRKRELIVLEVDPDDARARIVELTTYGSKYLQQVRVFMHQIESRLEERFDKSVIDVVRMVVKTDWGPPVGEVDDQTDVQGDTGMLSQQGETREPERVEVAGDSRKTVRRRSPRRRNGRHRASHP